jgi:hypothetical protein
MRKVAEMVTTRRSFLPFAILAALGSLAACDVRDGRFDPDEEFSAGGIDPYNFPPPYRGTGAQREIAASGTFVEVGAFAKGRPIGYYQFPFSPGQIQTTNYSAPSATSWPEGVIDPLRVSGPGTDFRASLNNPVPVPLVYNFDPPGGLNPFAKELACEKGDPIDPYREAVPVDTQWNIFSFPPDRFTTFPFGGLPTWNYRPVVAEVSVGIRDIACQGIKSERTLLKNADDGKVSMDRLDPEPDKRRLGKPGPDRYLAWAMIDPGAAVVRVGQKGADVLQGGKITGTSVQKYGWYGQFIVAYIDGGYIPVEDGPRVAGAPTKRMRTQRLYYPRSTIIKTGATRADPGGLGQGYDVLQASRFDDGPAYSPVCEVWTYSLPAGTRQADIPKDEATILAVANSTLEPAFTAQTSSFTPSLTVIPRYIFCLQAAPREP